MIYLTAVGLPPGDSSTVHIYTQTIRRTTQFSSNNVRISASFKGRTFGLSLFVCR